MNLEEYINKLWSPKLKLSEVNEIVKDLFKEPKLLSSYILKSCEYLYEQTKLKEWKNRKRIEKTEEIQIYDAIIRSFQSISFYYQYNEKTLKNIENIIPNETWKYLMSLCLYGTKHCEDKVLEGSFIRQKYTINDIATLLLKKQDTKLEGKLINKIKEWKNKPKENIKEYLINACNKLDSKTSSLSDWEPGNEEYDQIVDDIYILRYFLNESINEKIFFLFYCGTFYGEGDEESTLDTQRRRIVALSQFAKTIGNNQQKRLFYIE